MQRKLWISLALLLVIPGLLFTVSCAKKTVKSSADTKAVADTASEEAIAATKARQTAIKAAEDAKKEELARKAAQDAARKKAAEETRRQQALLAAQKTKADAEKRKVTAARQMFEGEHIYFEFDQSRLMAAAQEVLKGKAQWLRGNPDTAIIIEGHCDERGTNEYNLALGERRANSAKQFLLDLGIASSRLSTISYGEERALDPGHNEEAWAKNRRAQFVVD